MTRLEQVIRQRQPDLTVVMENIHDPHNVSAVLRSCDAAGVYEVQLIYTNEEYPGIGKKSSSSAKKWVERKNFPTVPACYAALRNEGFTILATRLDDRAAPLYDIDLTKKVALVFGNEHRGVSDEAADQADGTVMIPMMGMIQSLNVSVACAVTLFEAVRQRMAAGKYGRAQFSEEEVAGLLKAWAMKE
jgi:tRNA (guanosine-2'-O-)-methyltransferase